MQKPIIAEAKKQSLFSTFKILYWDYRSRFLALGLLGVISGLLGGLGIATLVPLFSFIVKTGAPSNDFISQIILGLFSLLHISPGIKTLLIFISVTFVLKAGIIWVFDYIRVIIASGYILETRTRLFRGALKSSWSYLLNHKIGFLEKILMDDLNSAIGVLKSLINIIKESTNSLIYLVVAFTISPLITFLTICIGGLVLLFAKVFVGKTRIYGSKGEALKKIIAHEVNESILGIKTVKIAGTETNILENNIGFFKKLRALGIKNYFATSATSDPLEPLIVIFIAIVFAASYTLDANFNIGAFLTTIYLIQKLFDFISKIPKTLHSLNDDLPHAYRLVSFENDVINNQETDTGTATFEFNSVLEFKNVSFAYNNRQPIMINASFKIKKGEMFGIIGPTGSGKTTIADLFLRLFSPESGEILIDGKNINTIKLNDWRKNIGYVSQDIFLKNDTIKNNIKFYDTSITDVQVIEAAKKANIYDFIMDLPHGFNTVVGERGVLLSGGQRQRVVLARVFVRRPTILILDEATSSLDNQSEALIKESIEKLHGTLTTIVISHRLSFIMNVDRVIALNGGQISETGSPKNLLADTNSYLHRTFNL